MFRKLLNPFAYFDDKILLIVGFFAHFIFSYICYISSSYFPDFLSIQKVKIAFPFPDIVYQNTRNVFIAVVIFYIFGKMINSKTRLVDIINVVLISRIAYYAVFITDFIPFINHKIDRLAEGVLSNDFSMLHDISTMTIVVIVAFIAIFFMALMFYYLYIGFKTVTNMKSIQQTIAFVAVVLFLIIFTSILALIIPQKI